ncbi:unnamed protein product [Trifolium pratense]|uniref:Uncharacterized protein n=1 Tax=Trifolium pratense TaxID=57577 RepID=A0ACB0IY33_TRIPR|nr:unnamed protein product [Trifolium pratense]
MASSSHFNNDVEDAAPPPSPRLSPALITDLQALPESDSRDGQETSWTSEDGDLVVLTKKQAGKRPQPEQGKSAETDLSAASVTNAELAALIAALKQTTEVLQGQNRRMDEQNLRLDRLERNQRFSTNNSPPRRTPTSQSPPQHITNPFLFVYLSPNIEPQPRIANPSAESSAAESQIWNHKSLRWILNRRTSNPFVVLLRSIRQYLCRSSSITPPFSFNPPPFSAVQVRYHSILLSVNQRSPFVSCSYGLKLCGGEQALRIEDGYSAHENIGRLNVLDLQVFIDSFQITYVDSPTSKTSNCMVAGYAGGGGHVLHMVCDSTVAAG